MVVFDLMHFSATGDVYCLACHVVCTVRGKEECKGNNILYPVSCPTFIPETNLDSSAITSTDTGREAILFLVFLLIVVIAFLSKSISLIFKESITIGRRFESSRT